MPSFQSFGIGLSNSDCENIKHKNSLKISFVPFSVFELVLLLPEEEDNEKVSTILEVPRDEIKIWLILRQPREGTVGTLTVSSVAKMEVKQLFIIVERFSALIDALCFWKSSILFEMERGHSERQNLGELEMVMIGRQLLKYLILETFTAFSYFLAVSQ